MANNSKFSSPRAQLGLFIFLLGIAWLITNLFAAVVLLGRGAISAGHPTLDFENPQMVGTLKSIQAISTVIMFGMPALLYSRITFRRNELHFLGFRPPRSGLA